VRCYITYLTRNSVPELGHVANVTIALHETAASDRVSRSKLSEIVVVHCGLSVDNATEVGGIDEGEEGQSPGEERKGM